MVHSTSNGGDKSLRSPFQQQVAFWKDLESDHHPERISNFHSQHPDGNRGSVTGDDISQTQNPHVVRLSVPVPTNERSPTARSVCKDDDGPIVNFHHAEIPKGFVEDDLKPNDYGPSALCSRRSRPIETHSNSSVKERISIFEQKKVLVNNNTTEDTDILFDESEIVSKSDHRSGKQSVHISNHSPVIFSNGFQSMRESFSPTQVAALQIYSQAMICTEDIFNGYKCTPRSERSSCDYSPGPSCVSVSYRSIEEDSLEEEEEGDEGEIISILQNFGPGDPFPGPFRNHPDLPSPGMTNVLTNELKLQDHYSRSTTAV